MDFYTEYNRCMEESPKKPIRKGRPKGSGGWHPDLGPGEPDSFYGPRRAKEFIATEFAKDLLGHMILYPAFNDTVAGQLEKFKAKLGKKPRRKKCEPQSDGAINEST